MATWMLWAVSLMELISSGLKVKAKMTWYKNTIPVTKLINPTKKAEIKVGPEPEWLE